MTVTVNCYPSFNTPAKVSQVGENHSVKLSHFKEYKGLPLFDGRVSFHCQTLSQFPNYSFVLLVADLAKVAQFSYQICRPSEKYLSPIPGG